MSRSEPSPVVRPDRRWFILFLLLALTAAAYVQRTAISVAAEPMMPALGLTQVQIGWLEVAFLASYTVGQTPGGIAGQWLGARRMLSSCGALAVLATVAVPLLPSVARGSRLFVLLLAAQLVLGAAQAPVFAMVSAVLERWFAPRQWALTQGLSACGIGLGAAAAPVLISVLMVRHGWRAALIVVALPVALLVAVWWWQGRDAPGEAPPRTQVAPLDRRAVLALLGNPHLLGLSASYLLMNVVFYLITFWSFLYLVQARHLAVLQGGLATAVPLLAGALGAALGGVGGSAAHRRFGARWGLRLLPLLTLPASCVLLLVGVKAAGATAALAALSLAFLLLEANEAPFWAASMQIGGDDAAVAGGILNTGGNLGGIVATPIVAAMSAGGNWTGPFVLAAGAALAAAALWLMIDPAPGNRVKEGLGLGPGLRP